MAQVAWKYEPGRFISHDLERLLAFWRTVPEMVEEWPQWDDHSRFNFIIEWPIDRERLFRVRHAAAAGLLNERQQREWQELQRLIEMHRATVEWMLDGPI